MTRKKRELPFDVEFSALDKCEELKGKWFLAERISESFVRIIFVKKSRDKVYKRLGEVLREDHGELICAAVPSDKEVNYILGVR